MIKPLIVLMILIGQCAASSSISVNLYDDGQTFSNSVALNNGVFCEDIWMEPMFGISVQNFGHSWGDATFHEKHEINSPFPGYSFLYEMGMTSVNRDTSWSTLIDGNRLESQVFSAGKA